MAAKRGSSSEILSADVVQELPPDREPTPGELHLGLTLAFDGGHVRRNGDHVFCIGGSAMVTTACTSASPRPRPARPRPRGSARQDFGGPIWLRGTRRPPESSTFEEKLLLANSPPEAPSPVKSNRKTRSPASRVRTRSGEVQRVFRAGEAMGEDRVGPESAGREFEPGPKGGRRCCRRIRRAVEQSSLNLLSGTEAEG